MKKMLFAGVFSLVPFVAFAGNGWVAAGDLNSATTQAGSTAGVSSVQGTGAMAKAGGNGGVMVGAVSGNYTSVDTGSSAQTGPGGSSTHTAATQTNVGGTISGGLAANKHGNGASGVAGGAQTSSNWGTSSASAKNSNVGGFAAFGSTGHKH
jgi:hypothetical protein